MVAVAGTGWVLAPSLVAYVREADRYYPQRDRESDGSIGDLGHQARVSDHNPDDGYVHAVDLDEDLAPGLDLGAFAEKLRTRRDDRIKYVIYEGRIFSSAISPNGPAWQWRPYDGVNAHEHHLHLSILHTDAARNDLSPWGFAPATPKPAPIAPEEDDMAHIVTCSGKPTRLKDGPTCSVIGAKTKASAQKAGIKVIDYEPADYDALLKHVEEALGR